MSTTVRYHRRTHLGLATIAALGLTAVALVPAAAQTEEPEGPSDVEPGELPERLNLSEDPELTVRATIITTGDAELESVELAADPAGDDDGTVVVGPVEMELVEGEDVPENTYEGTLDFSDVDPQDFDVQLFLHHVGDDEPQIHLLGTVEVYREDGRTGQFHLSNTWRGTTDVVMAYGKFADEVFIGDWDGDGRDSIAVRKGANFHVSNSFRGGDADYVLTYGRPGDDILVGDWDGDGKDTFAVRRGAEYHVKNQMIPGWADVVFTYGRADDHVLVGDWNGDANDTFTVRRGATYHVKNSLSGGDADVAFAYGREGDVTLAGDWNGDGTDTFTVQRGWTYYVNNSLRGGDADTVLTFGREGDEVYVGDWNGDGIDTLGIRRPL